MVSLVWVGEITMLVRFEVMLMGYRYPNEYYIVDPDKDLDKQVKALKCSQFWCCAKRRNDIHPNLDPGQRVEVVSHSLPMVE